MTRAPGILIPLLAAALVAGCGSGPPPEAADRDVVRPEFHFALDVPEGWRTRELEGHVVLELLPPGEGKTDDGAEGPRAVVQVLVIARDGRDLQAVADESVEAVKALQPEAELVGREAARLGGRDAIRLRLENERGRVPMQQTILLVMAGNRAYALTATARGTGLKDEADALRVIRDSFLVW